MKIKKNIKNDSCDCSESELNVFFIILCDKYCRDRFYYCGLIRNDTEQIVGAIIFNI